MTDQSAPPSTQTTEPSPVDTEQIGEEFAVVLSTLTGFRQQITMLQNHIRGLEKNVRRKMKAFAARSKEES